ncbi:OprD family outer membrane porin [Sulfurovum sp.]|uniref:OprD family outer membrane porin n=1 Tax=Sulfurovum sp. TaxID=1969726 RepID=UPI0025EE83F3|nr:OprD family outer membrane porin [Sulfurovum sp.]
MKIVTLCTISLMIMSININANALKKAFENATVDGYVRTGYEVHNVKNDDTFNDGALGGKLHIETAPIAGMGVGASFYTSNSFGSADNRGLVPFRGEVAHSYAILGEAYLKAQFGNTTLKFGRQEIETPFAQVDDIGMVPNTFEAYTLENKDIPDTTLFLGQIQKMAGVDAEVVDDFTRVNGNNNMQVIGFNYEGIKNTNINAWYYRLKDAEMDSIAYLEASYEGSLNGMGYGIGLQYAKQTYLQEHDTSVCGVNASLIYESAGLTLGAAYNKADGNAATSGFGGGPFFSNSEYLIIDNAGKDGSQTWFGAEFDAGILGIDGLTVSLSKAILKTHSHKESTEVDLVANYKVNKNIEIHMICSDLKGKNVGEDTAKHLRVFANYNF